MSDKNILQLSSRYPKTSISFDSLMCLVNEVVCHHGVSGVRHGWCENEAPLFELTIKPGDDFSKLLRTAKQFQTKLAIKVEAMFSKSLATSPPTPLSVDVHTELYMVTPNAANSSIHLVPVASDNLLVCLDLWRESAVFDFGAAFIAYRTEPTLDGDEGACSVRKHLEGREDIPLGMYPCTINCPPPPPPLPNTLCKLLCAYMCVRA